MIFPNLNELIQLKQKIAGYALNNKSATTANGAYNSLFHGLGMEFETVRQYVVGDDVRHIDWRVSARIGKPHVKTFRAECDRNVLILVDQNAYMRFGTRGTFKSIQAAKACALLSWQSLQLQDRVGGLIFGDIQKGMQYFKPTKDNSAVLHMLKQLCVQDIDVHKEVTTTDAISYVAKIIPPQSLVFIISDFAANDMQQLHKALQALRSKCTLVLLPVQDPSDSTIPGIGPVIFANSNDSFTVNTDDNAACQQYKNIWQAYADNLGTISKKLRAPLIWLHTTVDPIKSLLKMQEVSSWKI